jgi:hypothetical protein
MPNDDFSYFFCRVVFIIENGGKWIVKRRTGFDKTYAMFTEVDSGLTFVPFEPYAHLACRILITQKFLRSKYTQLNVLATGFSGASKSWDCILRWEITSMCS